MGSVLGGGGGGGMLGFAGDLISAPFELVGINPHELPLIGSMLGPSDSEQAVADQMRRSAATYGAMMGPLAEAQSQMAGNVLNGIGGPGNGAMGDVYGPQAQMNFGMASQNPVTPEMLAAVQGGVPQAPQGGGMDPMGTLLAGGPLGAGIAGPAMLGGYIGDQASKYTSGSALGNAAGMFF